ncbi:MAG: family 43 glycosylhydrolase [Lachnospiraceae bacterium]|nr:family 43 glycosylhydrolase [Lachnospiraceae bacterium]
MKKQAVNPYLPLDEYVPDGEPRVFDNRLYIFGSHDRSHGNRFCMNDYVGWSAPCDNLADWRYEGVIYRKTDDPNNPEKDAMYAPDVVKGPDGRYYMFYGHGSRKPPEQWCINVAVCSTPAGRYQYYGRIELSPWSESYFPFDPAILVDEDGRVWLYYGFGSGDWRKGNKGRGGAVVELAPDMLTVLSEPGATLPNKYTNTDETLQGHAFFEASSIRKINGKYYFIYSSQLSHELCYATADAPDGPFRYRGVLISNGDYGLNGNTVFRNWWGNNHGSLVEIDGTWYIFYHRHTQQSAFSRQGCAEKITMSETGDFVQAECTSCGLNQGPLLAKGKYSAVIAANLYNGADTSESICCRRAKGTYFDEETAQGVRTHMIKRFGSSAHAVYKYFLFEGETGIQICIKGKARGVFTVIVAGDKTDIPIDIQGKEWESITGVIRFQGESAMEFLYSGTGTFAIRDFGFTEREAHS